MEVANLFDNGPISPIARINEHVAAYVDERWHGYQIQFIEPIIRSAPFTIEMVALAGVVTIAAGQSAVVPIVPALQQYNNEISHFRWFPLDDVEGAIWQNRNTARNAPRGGQSRTSLSCAQFDPYLASTTFFVIGPDNDAQIGAVNTNAVAVTIARFCFFGFRYVVGPEEAIHPNAVRIPCQGM